MLVLPIRTDRRLKHTPWMNVTLIAINVIVFLYTGGAAVQGEAEYRFVLQPIHPEWYQFFTYQFLHLGWEHILFNMFFLWVFGNSIEDRLGHVGYLGFYLCGGVIAGFSHSLVTTTPVLGASGSIAAVTGAYLALFPRSEVTLFFWFFLFIHFFEVPSMWLVLLAIGHDVLFSVLGIGQVAYLAHVGGYAFGFGIGMALLGVRILPREPYDFLALIDRWNRRRQMRLATRQGGSPWSGEVTNAKPPAPPSEADQRVLDLRSEVSAALAERRADKALDSYEKLIVLDPQRPLSRQAQLDIANHAMNAEHYQAAAHAYELFLSSYGVAGHREVELILGLIYARYLNRPDRARELLASATANLPDDPQRQLAQQALEELGPAK